MEMQQLLIIGAGGFGRETVELVHAINDRRATWELLGFVDDAPELWNTRVDNVPVLGSLDVVKRFPAARLVATVGHPGNYFSRKRIVSRLGLDPSRFETLVHPLASIPTSASIGPGSVISAGVVMTAGVLVGNHVEIMPGCILTHDDAIEDFVTMGAGVRLGGTVRICEGAYVGAGALVRERVTVGAWSLIGMGAAVLHDVPPGEIWVGVPAHKLSQVNVPADIHAADG